MESTGVQTRIRDALNNEITNIQHLVFSGDGRVPYDNPVPESEHRKTKIRSIDWLLSEGIISKAEERSSLNCKFLTPDEWRMIQSTPGHYWPCAFAKGLTEEEYQSRLSRFVPPPNNPLFKADYLFNQDVWFAVSNIIFEQRNGRYPTKAEEEKRLEAESLFSIYRAFYCIVKGIGMQLSYHPWGEDAVAYCRMKRNEQEQRLREQKALRVGAYITEWAHA